MTRFNFRLASLLKLRLHAREVRQMELASALRRLSLTEQSRKEVREEISLLETHMRASKQGSTIEVDRLLDGHRYHLALAARCSILRGTA